MAEILPTQTFRGSASTYYNFTLNADTDYAVIPDSINARGLALLTVGLAADDIEVQGELGLDTGVWGTISDVAEPISDGYIYEKVVTLYSSLRIVRNGSADGPIALFVGVSRT